MDFNDGSSSKTPLILALERGIQRGDDLAAELRKLGDYTIKSQVDADAICDVLERLERESAIGSGESPLHAIVSLFQEIKGVECPAFEIMSKRGIDILARIVDAGLGTPPRHDPDDVLFALKILAMYGTAAGTDAVLRAVKRPFRPEEFMWSVILGVYGSEHPERRRLFSQLSEQLPTGIIAVSLLDGANAAHREGTDDRHPFDSGPGVKQLEQWLLDENEELVSYARSATIALPFISHPNRDGLLAIAFDHTRVDVQLEADRSAANLGRESGIKWLVRLCLDVNQSAPAQCYLHELGHSHAIPSECQDPSFRAKAEFAHWLAHPCELGHPPDELKIVDQRELTWPPEREQKTFWLIKYRMIHQSTFDGCEVGVGLVGSVTFCLFNYRLEQRPPEDAYAIHCYWEMKNRGLIAEIEVAGNSSEFNALLNQYQHDELTNATVVTVAEFSHELRYPQRLIALAKATCRGEPGWMICDGPRSRWHAASDWPQAKWDKMILMVHIGRVLLNFNGNEDHAIQHEAGER